MLRRERRVQMTRFMIVPALFLVGLAAACSSPAVPPGASNGTAATPGNPGGVAGATRFHLVLSDGPKAGTWDISTTDPASCSVADVGYFVADYLETANPGLDYVSATLHPGNLTGLNYVFDSETDNKIVFVGTGTVTVTLDDRGSTATMKVVSEKNVGSSDSGPAVQTGRAELTVECGAILR